MTHVPLPDDVVGRTLRSARLRRGISIAALAAEACVNPRLTSELNKGKAAR